MFADPLTGGPSIASIHKPNVSTRLHRIHVVSGGPASRCADVVKSIGLHKRAGIAPGCSRRALLPRPSGDRTYLPDADRAALYQSSYSTTFRVTPWFAIARSVIS